jgi:ribokinase
MPELVVVGSVALDDIRTPFGEVSQALGGAAVYASVAASFFSDVGVVGIVGEDFPNEYVEFLLERGICTDGLAVSNGKTFRWHGAYEGDMNSAETISTELNVFEKFRPELPEEYKKAKYLFLANIDPDLQMSVIKQMEKPELVVMDSMNYWIENKRERIFDVLEMCDIVLLNSDEARQLFNTHNTIHAGKQLLKMGLKAAIIKKGEHGALLFTKNGIFSAPAYPVDELKDPTGAGDSFAGGMVGWLAKTKELNDYNIRRAVIFGSIIASFSAEGFGLDNLKKITAEDIETRYEEFRRIVEF